MTNDHIQSNEWVLTISAPSSCACPIVELSVAAVGDDQSHDLARLGFGASNPSSVPSAAQSKGSSTVGATVKASLSQHHTIRGEL